MKACAAFVFVLSVCTVAHAQDTCTVTSRSMLGVPRRITCGELQLYAVTPTYISRAAMWEGSLRRVTEDLDTCNQERSDIAAASDWKGEEINRLIAEINAIEEEPVGYNWLEVVAIIGLENLIVIPASWALGRFMVPF